MNLKFPRISVVTPSLNQAEFIERTITSVLDQNYPNLEYLVIDGGSTDGTLEILRKYDGRVTWISEKDRGQSDAINKGLRRASGEILAYLNSDDFYEAGALQRVGRYFVEHPEAYWVAGKCRIVDVQGKEIRKAITAYKNLWLWTRSYTALLVLDYISQPATFWRRSVLERIGLFDENEHLSLDYDYSLRVGRVFPLNVVDAYLANFRIHPESKSRLIQEHFDTDLAVACRNTRSPLLRGAHRLHNAMIVGVYKLLTSSPGP